MKSIIQKDNDYCFICKRHKTADFFGLDKHHIFNAYNKNNSERYGLFVYICHDRCHLNGVHKHHELDLKLKQYAQRKAMEHYGWSIKDFLKIFGTNYL